MYIGTILNKHYSYYLKGIYFYCTKPRVGSYKYWCISVIISFPHFLNGGNEKNKTIDPFNTMVFGKGAICTIDDGIVDNRAFPDTFPVRRT